MGHSMHGFLNESAWRAPSYIAMAPAHGQLHVPWVQGARRRHPRLMARLMHASLRERARRRASGRSVTSKKQLGRCTCEHPPLA